MNSKLNRIVSATLLLAALAVGQLCVPVGFAQAQQVTAILTTANNQPITVNGTSTVSGATIMSGATIETPDAVGASISLPGHFTLELPPRANVTVTFDQNGIKVTVVRGCVVLRTTRGTAGEIVTSATSRNADTSKDDRLEICDPSIATAPAAVGAGGLSTAQKVLIVGAIVGGFSIIPLVTRGSNPSPGTP
jgi:hypothetical protein